MILYYYPKCSTCIKAKKYLEERGLDFKLFDLSKEPPNVEELEIYARNYPGDLKDFFNVRGQVYKVLGLKEKYDSLTDKDRIKLLSEDGMLIKRPLLVTEEQVLLGFKEKEWNDASL